MFLAKHSPLVGYHGNNEWSIPKLLILKDDLYNCLKSCFVKIDQTIFEVFSHFAPPPSPNRVNKLKSGDNGK